MASAEQRRPAKLPRKSARRPRAGARSGRRNRPGAEMEAWDGALHGETTERAWRRARARAAGGRAAQARLARKAW